MKKDAGYLTKRIYSHPDLGDDPLYDWFENADKHWTAKVQRFIVTHYPLHHFCADINCRHGYIKVYIPELMGTVNGYVLHIRDLKGDEDFSKKMHGACGEILERYRIPRARFSEAAFKEAMDRGPIFGLQRAPVPE